LLYVYSVLLSKKLDVEESAIHAKGLSEEGEIPIPICTACYDYPDASNRHFMEFSPWEVGSVHQKMFFRYSCFRLRPFINENPPRLSLLMAVWGSAFYASFGDVLKSMGVDLGPLSKFVDNVSLGGIQMLNPNFERFEPGTGRYLPTANHRWIELKDGGILANIPAPPLIREERGVELLIVFDASAKVGSALFGELKKAIPELEVPTKEVTFPYLFKKTDHHPAIIYIPLMKNETLVPKFDPDSCPTLQFIYEESAAKSVFDLAYKWTELAFPLIKQFLAEKGLHITG